MTATSGRPPAARAHRFGFWAATYTFAVVMAFSTAPSPLYVLYGRRDHFSALIITVIYAVYAVGVLASLFLVSHRSDVHGRRVHLLGALGLAVASAGIFIVWPSLPGLFLTRIISGVSVGLTVSTATAYLTELHQIERPGTHTSRAQLAATVANLGGLAAGGLLAGLLGQYVAFPLVVPYLLLLALLITAIAVVAGSPETRPRARPRPAYRAQRVATPPEARGQFFAALLGVFFAYAPAALVISSAGTFLAVAVGNHSLATAGLVVFVFFAAGSAVLVLTHTWNSRRLLTAGLLADIGGLGLLVLSAWLPTPSLGLFLLGSGIAGPAAAALFKATMARVIAIAPANNLGEALAGFFLAGYLGLSIPAIGIGIALEYLSPRLALLIFAAAIIAGVLAVAPILLTRSRRHQPVAPAVTGRVYDADGQPVLASLTLASDSGVQVDHAHTGTDGCYHLTAPAAGTYLLACVPARPAQAHLTGQARLPQAGWVRLDAGALQRDFHLVYGDPIDPAAPHHTAHQP
jgi:MFS family permease